MPLQKFSTARKPGVLPALGMLGSLPSSLPFILGERSSLRLLPFVAPLAWLELVKAAIKSDCCSGCRNRGFPSRPMGGRRHRFGD
jgi:hypothetical protein